MKTCLKKSAADGKVNHGEIRLGDGGVSQEDAGGHHDGDDQVAGPCLEGKETGFFPGSEDAFHIFQGEWGEHEDVNGDGYDDAQYCQQERDQIG